MEKIYQLTTAPINEDDYITASDYEDSWFVPSIAEYVRDSADRRYEIGILMNMLETNLMAVTDREANSFILQPNAKSIYFEGRYSRFRKLLAELGRAQENKFICCHSEVEGLLYQLNRCFSERFGSYIAGDQNELTSLDEFIRTADEGITYYVGGIVAYHI